jgi:cytochrome c-type biogenesis protein CcmE
MPAQAVRLQKRNKFGIGIAIFVASLACLAPIGYGEGKTYYYTIVELQDVRGDGLVHRMRVGGGTVAPGSIGRFSGRVDSVLNGEGKSLCVSYISSDPLPDTL